ncbi:MAG: sensor histidine kinase, partial [Rhizobiales bacterium]|nr:sensor histidine kinase [Hyphomicrobiales bacterium]
EILIELERGEDGKAVLTLADRGVGFDPNAASRSLGLRLVRSFSEQLGGDYRLDGAGGLSYRLTLAAA